MFVCCPDNAIGHKTLEGAPLLVLANKQDIEVQCLLKKNDYNYVKYKSTSSGFFTISVGISETSKSVNLKSKI